MVVIGWQFQLNKPKHSRFPFILQVALLHTSTLSVLFITDYVSDTSSPVVSLAMKTFSDTNGLLNGPEDSESKTLEDLGNRPLFVMTRNARITAINSQTGKIVTSQSMYPEKDSTAISMYIIGKYIKVEKKVNSLL